MTTKEEVRQSINSRLKTAATKIEGGLTQDIIGSVSYELANIIDTKIDVILDNAFVSTADIEHLKIKGEELGLFQNEATSAIVVAKITNASPNTKLPDNFMAQTTDGIIFKNIEEKTTNESGFLEIQMECLTKGNIGNIKQGTLTEFYDKYEGFENAQITNENSGYNGFEEETTEEFRERILTYLRDDAANSNIADYSWWAKEVAGVKNVIVEDATEAGAGNVNVYISAMNNLEVSKELIASVKEKIQSEQIINANLNVLPLEYLKINITADIKLKEGFEKEAVKSEFSALVENYLSKLPSFVSYLYISNLFFETEGIEDVSNYLLNSGTESISISKLQVPVVGEIVLNTIE